MLAAPATCVFVLVSSQTGFNHHYRYVLPTYPFVFILISGVLVVCGSKIMKRVAFSLICLQMVSVLWIAPHWLSYFNELCGGPASGRRWLSDSNVDWGQDLYALVEWKERNIPNEPLYVCPFTCLPVSALGRNSDTNEFRPFPFSQKHDKTELQELKPGWYAISVCMSQGRIWQYFDENGHAERFQLINHPFTTMAPRARVGYTIEIFYVGT